MKTLSYAALLLATAALVVGEPGRALGAVPPDLDQRIGSEHGPESDSDAADVSGRRRLVETLAARFDIRIDNPGDWTVDDLNSLVRGAEAMPRATWEVVDGPLTIEFVDRACLFATGRYNESCPTFADEAKTHFFVYEPAPLVGEGPAERLEILTRDEQRDIQIRRAVVHLAVVHLDEKFDWSERRKWRAVNGWPAGSGDALNRDAWGYSRYLGMHSAHLDLVTFAEQFFVRPEDLLFEQSGEWARRRLEHLDPNRRLNCQQFTKRRLFNRHLDDLDPEWTEPDRRLPGREADAPECPAFERWARPDELEGFEILLAAASADDPESLFGHLLLHVRYDSEDRVHGDGFEPVYQFGAITDTDVDPIEYLTRGFLGGFPSILERNTFGGIGRLFLQYQQRDLRRYRLKLSDAQSRQLLERIWEAERRIRYPYLFLSDNCASFLLELLAPAVDIPIPERPRGIVMPTDVLDVLAEMESSDGESLLEKQSETFRSNRELAEESVRQRRALVGEIAGRLEDHPDRREEFEELVEDFEELEPGDRTETYERAGAVFDSILAVEPGLAQRLVDVIYHSVRIERYFTEMSQFARRTVYAQTHSEDSARTIDEILERRRRIYRNEDMEARMEAFRELTREAESALADGPRRELTESEQRIVDYDESTRDAYLTALELQSTLIERHLPDWSGVEYLEGRAREYRRDQSRIDDRSTGASGRHRLSIGGHWENAGSAGRAELSYSLIRDRLGEIRRRGYRAELGTRILGLDATVPVTPDALHNLQMELVVLRYQSLRQTVGPLREKLRDRFGWSLDGRLTHDGRRELLASGELTPSVLWPLWTSENYVDHLVVRTGPGLRYDVHDDQDILAGGVVGLFGQLHLYGNYANVVRVGVETGQFGTLGLDWRYDLSGRAESRHVVATFNQRPLVVAPYAESLWTTRDYRTDGPDHGFRTWEAGLEVELPF